VLWKLRAIVYGGLAIVVALVLIGSGGEDEPTFLEGRTAQGNRFTMELEDGRPVTIGTYLDATCDSKGRWRARWWSFDGHTTRFDFDDGRLSVRETVQREYDDGWAGVRKHSITARLDDDGVRGMMSFAETMRQGDFSYRCSSGPVSFSAR
jgi:hypothetical protein